MPTQLAIGPSRPARLLRGLGALLTLTALLMGIPWLLLTVAGNPLPDQLPSLGDIATALTTRDGGQLFLGAMALAAWAGWATFALSVLIEVPAAIRRRPTRRLPGLGPQQRLAAALVAAVTLTLATPAVASAATARPLTAAPTSVAPVGTGQIASAAAPATPGVVSTSDRSYVVREGDWLSGVAARFLGDPDRYPELARLNGLADPDQLRHGQHLRLPAEASDRGSRPHATGHVTTSRPTPESATYVVHAGDWLSGIATRFLGDARRYPDLAGVNGLADPDQIHPGQHLRLPAGASDRGPGPHATGALLEMETQRPGPTDGPQQRGRQRSPGAPSTPSSAPTATPTAPSATPSQSPTASAPSRAGATATPTPATPAQTETHTDRHADDDTDLDQLLPIGAPLAGAGLLAALLLATLRRRRQRQQQHRPPGRRIPEPASPKAETNLRVVAQPAATQRLDHALRSLGVALLDRPGNQLPDIVGAWLEADTVHLLLTEPCPNPPTPWTANHTTWTLPADAQLPPAEGQLAPVPALVTVGSQPGSHLLLDLERLGLLSITGNPERVANLLRYLAAELACNTWSDYLDVTLAGFEPKETAQLTALGGERIQAISTVGEAVERVRRQAGRVIQALDDLDTTDPLTGRITDTAADAWMPQVLLAANPTPEDITALEDLDNDLASALIHRR